MPDFLLELFSEEIPARMQARAAEDLKKLVTQGMVDRGLTYAAAAAFATPRRLTLSITGMADLRANHMTQVGDDVVINDGAGLTITLADVVLADLHKADFIF